MKKLHISLMFSKLVVTKPLIAIIALMHNFIVKFGKILDIFKKFAGNRVNDLGNAPRRGVVPKSQVQLASAKLAICLKNSVLGVEKLSFLRGLIFSLRPTLRTKLSEKSLKLDFLGMY